MPRSSQIRRKTMRSMVRCTAKFRSRCDRSGFRRARFRARSVRHDSISSRNAASTSAVPFLIFLQATNFSSEPRRMASGENSPTSSSQRSRYSRVPEVDDPGGRRLVGLLRPDAAVVDGELLEIGQDAHRQLGRPGIAPQLEGGADRLADIDRRLLGLDEEAPHAAADAEAVVGGLGPAADLDGVLVDDFLVGVGVALCGCRRPSRGPKKRVEELLAELGLVVAVGAVCFPVRREPLDQFAHLCRRRHIGLLPSAPRQRRRNARGRFWFGPRNVVAKTRG